MSPAVLVGIEEVIRVPLRAEADDDHEDRIGERHRDPRHGQPSLGAHPVLPREEPEEDDRSDRSQGVQDQLARDIPVARRVDEPPVDEADDAGRHGQVAEQPELQTHLPGPTQDPHRAERDEAARPRREVREVLLGLELVPGYRDENLRRFGEDDHDHEQSRHQLRGTVADLTVSGNLFDDGFFSSGHYDVLSEGAYLHLRSKVVVQNNIIIT